MGLERVKVAIVGTGFGVGVHLPAFKSHPRFEVVALCGRNIGRTRAIAEREGVATAWDDYAKLVQSPDIDLVAVSTPPIAHAEVAAAAIESGKHVLCEKPLALTLNLAEELESAVRHAGLVNAVGFEWRYRSARRYLRDLVQRGVLGELRVASLSSFTDYAVNPSKEPFWHTWVSERRLGGGLLSGLLTHELDQVRYLFGDVVEVTGVAENAIRSRPVLSWDYRDGDPLPEPESAVGTASSDADDSAAIVGRLASGGVFSLVASWATHGGSGARFEAYGSKGTLTLDRDFRIWFRASDASEPRELHVPQSMRPTGPENNITMYQGLVDDLWQAFAPSPDRVPSFATFSDGLEIQKITEQVLGDITAD
jgi:predicted dehydrogenase